VRAVRAGDLRSHPLARSRAQLDVADGQTLRPLPFRDKADLKIGIKLSESFYQFPYCHGRQRNIVVARAEDDPGSQVYRWRRKLSQNRGLCK
jgi:hypothetical protein